MTRIDLVVGSLVVAALLCAASTAAQEEPILRFEGRVTYVSPWEMLVALDNGPVVMLDVTRIPRASSARSHRTITSS
ncbi:MAG TPA: hypothetical protein VFO18_18475 [Methylomirabilota bacterium]|nr:hypothetical protein [Methylomirabilota bacterium]